MRVAEASGAATLIICDIDCGGAFAHLYGTVELLPARSAQRSSGVSCSINFAAMSSLLAPGPERLEQLTRHSHDRRAPAVARARAARGRRGVRCAAVGLRAVGPPCSPIPISATWTNSRPLQERARACRSPGRGKRRASPRPTYWCFPDPSTSRQISGGCAGRGSGGCRSPLTSAAGKPTARDLRRPADDRRAARRSARRGGPRDRTRPDAVPNRIPARTRRTATAAIRCPGTAGILGAVEPARFRRIRDSSPGSLQPCAGHPQNLRAMQPALSAHCGWHRGQLLALYPAWAPRELPAVIRALFGAEAQDARRRDERPCGLHRRTLRRADTLMSYIERPNWRIGTSP